MKVLVVSMILIYSVLFHSSNGNSGEVEQNARSESQILIDSIPLQDRAHFVTFHISLASKERERSDVIFLRVHDQIPSEKLEEFRNIPVPANFSVNLLDWTELELVPLKNRQRNDLYCDPHECMKLCFPNGCVDPHDAGQLCCPF